MPTPTYTSLATLTLGSNTGTVTFGSIPATYSDLILVVAGTGSDIINVGVRLNADTGSNYSFLSADGNGSTGSSTQSAATALPEMGRMSSSQSNVIFQLMDYSATNKHTTILGRGNSTDDRIRMSATRWANTAAVTSITVFSFAVPRTFTSGTVFSLYGIVA
jgi:hypothetical protein